MVALTIIIRLEFQCEYFRFNLLCIPNFAKEIWNKIIELGGGRGVAKFGVIAAAGEVFVL